jgi:hypothetical protein
VISPPPWILVAWRTGAGMAGCGAGDEAGVPVGAGCAHRNTERDRLRRGGVLC